MEILIEIIGWLGMLLILIAYYLISSKRLEAKSILYQLFNLFGATGIVINAFYHKAFPSLALNTVWALIALWAMISGRKWK
jgi:cell division protein FtsW (lipid II flippase)